MSSCVSTGDLCGQTTAAANTALSQNNIISSLSTPSKQNAGTVTSQSYVTEIATDSFMDTSDLVTSKEKIGPDCKSGAKKRERSVEDKESLNAESEQTEEEPSPKYKKFQLQNMIEEINNLRTLLNQQNEELNDLKKLVSRLSTDRYNDSERINNLEKIFEHEEKRSHTLNESVPSKMKEREKRSNSVIFGPSDAQLTAFTNTKEGTIQSQNRVIIVLFFNNSIIMLLKKM